MNFHQKKKIKKQATTLKTRAMQRKSHDQQAHLLFTRTAPTTNQGVTRASKTQQRWCRCPGEIPQPSQDNDRLSKDCFGCIWQRGCSIHNGHWGSSPDSGGCYRSCLMRRSVDTRERPARRPDLPIRRLTGCPSSQSQVNTKRVKSPCLSRGLFVSKSLR